MGQATCSWSHREKVAGPGANPGHPGQGTQTPRRKSPQAPACQHRGLGDAIDPLPTTACRSGTVLAVWKDPPPHFLRDIRYQRLAFPAQMIKIPVYQQWGLIQVSPFSQSMKSERSVWACDAQEGAESGKPDSPVSSTATSALPGPPVSELQGQWLQPSIGITWQ